MSYAAFAETVERVGLAELAERADVKPARIRAILAGGRAPSLELRARLAAAAGVDAGELFRLDDDLEAVRADAEAHGLTWFVDDPATLRAVDWAQ